MSTRKPSDALDAIPLGTVEQERQLAKEWMDVAAEHGRKAALMAQRGEPLSGRLRDWTDWDIAEYHLGVVLGLFPEWPGTWSDPTTAPLKGIIWGAGAIGDGLAAALARLIAAGIVERNPDNDDQLRFAPACLEALHLKADGR